jgi:amidase
MRQVRFLAGVAVASVIAVLFAFHPAAVTRLPSADGQYWDVQDTSAWAQDSGGIATGGGANPFNGFGYLKAQVRRRDGSLLVRNRYLAGFGLTYDGADRFDSITPLLVDDVVVSRSLFAPRDTTYLRYFDSFTNVGRDERIVEIAWGGAAGAFEDGGRMVVAATASGDRRIDPGEAFVTVMQNARGVADPMRGPSGHGPSAHVLGSGQRTGVVSVGDMYANPFTDAWPGYDPAHIGYVFRFAVRPGETAALVTFVFKGLSEVYDPRGGFPVPVPNAMIATQYDAPYAGPSPRIPGPGTEIARVTDVARRLVAEPDWRGLTRRERAQVLNWPAPATPPPPPFSVVEKTADDLHDALDQGVVTTEDIVREYLARLATYDRNGPTLRAMLTLNPRVFVEARAADAERAAGRTRGVLHGVPVAFKDNIDVLGLPTTGGSRALADHRPRLDSRMAAGMRRGGAVILGKTNLDEFPFGDFGISTLGGTIGNAYDPSLSTAGSSGGSAVAVSTSLVTLAFGTDTCNSLSNPAAFASLATIRTTRGLTSRAGVMPLNTYNDAVGPLAKSVREVAEVLDLVAGSDPEDPVTADAARHIDGSFAAALGSASLKGARIGMLRQRFMGVTRDPEPARLMAGIAKELQAAGAAIVDVEIPDLDEQYRKARGSAPGSLKAGWDAYLARGAAPGEQVLTVEGLLASGKLAPASVQRFKSALQPSPTGDELTAATRDFIRRREAFRDLYVALLDGHNLDALIYPANLARPHTHEGGLERYGGEPGTCEDSAMTGLPQVTVPGGYLGGRYPFGVSFLGRPWSDRQLLGLAYAYERATRHRRPPAIATSPGGAPSVAGPGTGRPGA